MLDKRVEDLNLSVRTVNGLKRHGVFFLSQVLELSLEEISKFRNIGAKSIDEIEALKKKMDAELVLPVDEDLVNSNLVAYYAFPEYRGEIIKTITFRDSFGVYQEDINLTNIDFSSRTIRALLDEGFFTIGQICNSNYDLLVNNRKLSARNIEEIVDYIKLNANVLVDGQKSESLMECYQWFVSTYSYVECEANSKITNEIKKNISDIVDCDFVKSDSFVEEILAKENIRRQISYLLESIVNVNKSYFELDDIRCVLPEVFFELGLVNDSLSLMIQSRKIEQYNDGYRERLPRIEDWLDSLSDNQRIILFTRLNGGRLEDCGELIGVSKQRVQQILLKVMKQKPVLREDDYKYWYEKYLMNKEDFMLIFDENEMTYNYLQLSYRKGSEDIENITWDSNITTDIHVGLMKRLNRDRVIIDGEYVPLKREILCRKLAEEYFAEREATFDDFYLFYVDFLEENGIENNEKLLFPSERAFEARIADSKYVLQKYGRRFRYYPIEEYDVESLVNKLHFDRLDDVEISTRKLFIENQDLMQEYNLFDEYELHNLLKKTISKWQYVTGDKVKLGRMPLLTVGVVDRKKQALDLLYQIAPISMEEYAEFYENEYGMLSQTVVANIAPLLNEYYHNGLLEINQPLLTEDEIISLKQSLPGEFYFIEDLKKIFIEKYGKQDLQKLNARSIKQIGFKVYANYVISKKYSNSNEYFSTFLLKKDNVDFRELEGGRLSYIQAATKVLDDYRKEYILLEYEDMKFIKFERLNRVHPEITKERLIEYAEAAINFDSDKYFTIQSLRQRGFKNRLHGIGLDDWFFACLIRNHESVRFIKTGGNIVFRRGKRPITTVDFIRFILKQKQKMNIYDFINFIESEYGVNLEKDKIVYAIKETDLYYDDIMEKIYLNKDLYYEEV